MFSGHRGFLHVFAADAMCSLSKVLFDVGTLFSLFVLLPERPRPGSAMSLVPYFLASMPYFLRARQVRESGRWGGGVGASKAENDWRSREIVCVANDTASLHSHGQCLASYADARQANRYIHLLNAEKYASSLLPITTAALQSCQPEAFGSYDDVLTFFLVASTAATFSWDVLVDWGLLSLSDGTGGCVFFECARGVPVEDLPTRRQMKKVREVSACRRSDKRPRRL